MHAYAGGTQLAWETDGGETGELEWTGEEEVGYGETDGPFSEAEEMELATQLLEISDEQELDQFIGGLLKKAGRAIGKAVKSPIFRKLGGALKGVAKAALPVVGGALGSFIPIPGVGTAVGTALGSAVSKALEVELKGMDQEDQEFEMARRFVRLAGTAMQHAAQAPDGANAQDVAQQALMAAARRLAAGTSGETSGVTFPSAGPVRARRSGRWIRRRNSIILLGMVQIGGKQLDSLPRTVAKQNPERYGRCVSIRLPFRGTQWFSAMIPARHNVPRSCVT